MSAWAPRALWSLDEDVCFLNHGSFGATPRSVMAAQRRFQDHVEADPRRVVVRLHPRLARPEARVEVPQRAEPDLLVQWLGP